MSDAREDKSDVATEPPASLAGGTGASAGSGAALPELTGPGVWVRFAGRTAVGLVREHNEDNLVISNLSTGEIASRDVAQVDSVGEGGLLFAVCDGMGGAAAGEVASQMAVDMLQESLRREGPPRERDELARRLVASVEEAGKRIFESAQKERSRRGMGTTATVAVLIDKVLFIAEVGDSRAYLLRGGVLKQLTKDQSLVNQLIEAGHLTEAEAEAFEHSNIILQALGTSETVQVDLTFVELRRGDRLMLCSDGLSGLVHGDMLRDGLNAIPNPAECTAALIKYAEAGGGHDNITVLIADFGGDGLPALRETDNFGYLQYPLLPSTGAKAGYTDDEVTEASPSRTSLSPDDARARSVEEAGTGSGAASSILWVSAGVVALLAGAWLLVVSGTNGSVVTAPGERSQVEPAETKLVHSEPIAEPKPVSVRVFSDVQDAVLLVNGEPRGQLESGQGSPMELKPGAYRFEAQSNGNIAAVEVVTVRPEVPLDVFLRLPSGHGEAQGADKPASAAAGTTTVTAEAQPSAAAADSPDAVPAGSKPASAASAAAPKSPSAATVAAGPVPQASDRSPNAAAPGPSDQAAPGAAAAQQAAVEKRRRARRKQDSAVTAAPATPAPAAPEAPPPAPPVEPPPAAAPATPPAPAPAAPAPAPATPGIPDNPF